MSLQLAKPENTAALVFFSIVLLCILPIQNKWLGISHVEIYKKPIILLSGGILFLISTKRAFYISKLELFFCLFIFYQIVSAFWAFSINAMLVSVFDNLFLLLLLIWFSFHSNLSSETMAKLFLLFNTLLVLSLSFFWLSVFLAEGGLSLTNYTKFGRYFGYNTNYVGSLMAMSFPLYPLILQRINSRKVLIFGLIFLHILLLVSLNSRASLFVVLVYGILFLISTTSLKKIISRISLFIIVFLGILFIIALLFQDHQSFFEELNPLRLNGARLQIWKLTLNQLFMNNPFWGSGSNSWYLLFPTTDLGSLKHSFFETRYFTHAHNIFVERISELGIVGMISYLLFILFPLFQFIKIKDKKTLLPFFSIYIIYLFLASFYGVLYSSITEFSGPTVLWIYSMHRINSNYRKEFEASSLRYPLSKWAIIVIFSIGLFFAGCKVYQHQLYSQYKSARQQRDLKKAEICLLKIYNQYLFPNFTGFRNSAEIISKFYTKKDPESAILWMHQAIEDQPFNLDYKLRLSKLFRTLKKYESAKNLFKEVIDLNYTILEAHIGLAEIALIQKEEKVFKEYLKFPNEVITGLFRSKEINPLGEYLNHDRPGFWIKLEKLRKQIEALEKKSKKYFKSK